MEQAAERTRRAGYLLGGVGAVVAAILRVTIVAAFAVTGLGAAGDRSFGSFSTLAFIPAAALVVAVIGLYTAFAGSIGGRGRAGLVVAGLGLILTTIGQFGGAWLDFARSGNVVSGPGALLMMVGLIVFGMGTRDSGIPSKYRVLAILIATVPLILFPIAAAIETWNQRVFPPSLHENYFRILYALTSVLWLALGMTLLRDARAASEFDGSA